MKRIILYFIFLFVGNNSFANCKNIYFDRDSILRERFAANLLSEYDKPGRWIYTFISDSCSNKGSFRIVSVSHLFKVYKERWGSEYNIRESFILNATINLVQHNQFSNCEHYDNPIIGIETNFDIVSQLFYLSDEELLNTTLMKISFLRKKI